jgi:hypothetical protein
MDNNESYNVLSLDLPSKIDVTEIPPDSEITNLIDISLTIKETKSLVQLVEQLLESKDIKVINLNQSEINLLNLLIKNSPSSFQDIDKCLNKIIQDNTIDASDIPEFLTLVKNIYFLIKKLKENTNNFKLSGSEIVNTSANIIKFILPISLKKYDLDNEAIIKICNALIDSCVELLLIVPYVKSSKCGFFLF